ncbi:DUF2336 domain-containing protein [Asticcacaulis sp. ZE23SCel15]|uniref:DUF2336 domain-containing protein n=1 Tax=Asticcacaulis sp. ZE23SCel15 TaxID=3059027 RepID=UPI00265E9F06|nr:DUF2336 domain-containing protein [Asticcacaulis sp. ZE23SCel15]WKL56245.1 DUF2336 domain-containing protein [Asticcacaulis sp. ZE23SCel15]
MMTSKLVLSDEDLKRLVKSDNADDRAVAAHKICRVMERQVVSEAEREAAHEIIRLMAHDAAELVRRALSVTMRTSELLPHDVAMKLAQDVVSVAVPVLHYSPVFSDDDLRAVIEAGNPARQIAIAKRDTLSEVVTGALATHGVEEAVVIACANDNARFDEGGFGQVMDRFGEFEIMQSVLVHRQALPVTVTEKLVHLVSGALREQLVARHAVTPETAARISEAVQERATLDMAGRSPNAHDPKTLARHLVDFGRMTPSLMLRALVRGQMTFFEYALAELSGVPHERTWLMIHDAGSLGLRAIYDRAGLPGGMFATFKAAVETYHDLKAEQGHLDPIRLQERLIERFLTQTPTASREDIAYLMERLDFDHKGHSWANLPKGEAEAKSEFEAA